MNKLCNTPKRCEHKVQEHRHSDTLAFLGELELHSKGEIKQIIQEHNSILRFLSPEEV